MALNYVTLTLDLYDGQRNPIITGTALLTPSVQLTDATNGGVTTQAPVPAVFHSGGFPQVKLEATDSSGPLPAGWGWTITFTGVPGNPAPASFFLPFSGGASRNYSALSPVSAAVTQFPANPMTTLGDIITAAASGVPARLAGNTTAAREFLVSQGTGSAAQTPAYGALQAADIPPAGAAATSAVAVSTTAETVAASVTMPAGMPAGATYRVTAWGSVSIGGTAGTFVSKVRVGGLAGVQVSSASSGSFSIGGTGFWSVEAVVTLQVPGSSGTWSGYNKQLESVSGTNSNSAGAGTATASSLTTESLAVTIALSSATSSASCLGSTAERIA